MIQIRNLSKEYRGEFLYHDFSCCFEANKVNVIMGNSGSGKTTLLRMMLGLEKYDAGEILGLEHEKIAVVFQEDRLIESLNVYENINFVLQSYVEQEERYKRIEEVLEWVELKPYKDFSIQHLSGGMKRRVAVARALACDYPILFMDEPFKGLEDELKWRILVKLKKKWQANQTTVFYITHDEKEGMWVGDVCYKLVKKPVKFYKI